MLKRITASREKSATMPAHRRAAGAHNAGEDERRLQAGRISLLANRVAEVHGEGERRRSRDDRADDGAVLDGIPAGERLT